MTAAQVLFVCANFWAKPNPVWSAKAMTRDYDWLKGKEVVTMLDALRQRYFERWQQPKCVGTGKVNLLSRGFGT